MTSTPPDPPSEERSRQLALERLKAKRNLTGAVASYLIINAFLWILWAVTDDSKSGVPWPLWVTIGWGVGILFMVWNAYGRKPITEEDVAREMRRGGGIVDN